MAEMATVLAQTLGDRLRKAREQVGLDQAQLAERIGVSRGTVSNYEHGRGQKAPKVLVLRAWAHECGVSLEELTGATSDYGSEGWGFESLRVHSRPARPRHGRRSSDRRKHLSIVADAA